VNSEHDWQDSVAAFVIGAVFGGPLLVLYGWVAWVLGLLMSAATRAYMLWQEQHKERA
jgi:hypothetical protein